MKLCVTLLSLLLVGISVPADAQDYSWWNHKHQWDGITSWTDYMIVSPAFMGPNALPVPEIRKGMPEKSRSVEVAIDAHYSRGDQTGNLFSELNFPLFSDRAGLSQCKNVVYHLRRI